MNVGAPLTLQEREPSAGSKSSLGFEIDGYGPRGEMIFITDIDEDSQAMERGVRKGDEVCTYLWTVCVCVCMRVCMRVCTEIMYTCACTRTHTHTHTHTHILTHVYTRSCTQLLAINEKERRNNDLENMKKALRNTYKLKLKVKSNVPEYRKFLQTPVAEVLYCAQLHVHRTYRTTVSGCP